MIKGKINSIRTNRGITLIALVITIIVLLILAGIGISMLTGDNGILKQAVRAKEETEKKSTEEAVHLATLSSMTNTNHSIDETELEKELTNAFGEGGYTLKGNSKEGWTVKVNEETYTITSEGETRTATGVEKLKSDETKAEKTEKLEDLNGDKIVIPENFNIAKDSPTEVTEGIVIEDSDDNQYVWIPVFKKSETREWGIDYTGVEGKIENSSDYYNAIETALKKYTETYSGTGFTDSWYEDPTYGYTENGELHKYSNGNMTQDEYNTLYHNMLESVYENEGFYIGRYEMGKNVVTNPTETQENSGTEAKREYIASTDNTQNQKPTIGNAPVSKENRYPYGSITQIQAQMLTQKVGEEADYSKVKTSIMFGVQWDAVCVFIEKYDTKNTAPTKSDWLKNNDYGKLWGNYSNSTYKMDRGYYSIFSGNVLSEWKEKTNTKKAISENWVYTTGAVEQNKSLNIYDFGGNKSEWTLEQSNDKNTPCISRGDNYRYDLYASKRAIYSTYDKYSTISSRLAFFVI